VRFYAKTFAGTLFVTEKGEYFSVCYGKYRLNIWLFIFYLSLVIIPFE